MRVAYVVITPPYPSTAGHTAQTLGDVGTPQPS